MTPAVKEDGLSLRLGTDIIRSRSYIVEVVSAIHAVLKGETRNAGPAGV
jgi:hypothetical protein